LITNFKILFVQLQLLPTFFLKLQQEFQLHQRLPYVIEFNDEFLPVSHFKAGGNNLPGSLVYELDLDDLVESGLFHDSFIAPAHVYNLPLMDFILLPACISLIL